MCTHPLNRRLKMRALPPLMHTFFSLNFFTPLKEMWGLMKERE